MKSKYRQLVESIIEQEAKLADVKQLHNEAIARVTQTAEWVKFNEATLKELESKAATLELSAS